MTDEQVKKLSEAVLELAEAIRELGDRVANDEPLNFTIGRGLSSISEAIECK